MKEITRVHIAKVAYDIELTAKKQLEHYLQKLHTAAGDDEVLEDIEIRITELLQERGIQVDGVITTDDVASLRTQLGNPEEFASNTNTQSTETEQSPAKQLYRDIDNALLGGVLSGVAAYVGISTLLLRLIFVALLFISFGTAAIVYIVLWVLIPAATTSTQKLQMAGKPVTLAAMKEFAQTAAHTAASPRAAHTFKTIILYAIGIFCGLAAIGSLIATVWGGIVLGMAPTTLLKGNAISPYDGLFWLMYPLLVTGGILATIFFSTATYAAFSKRMTARIGVILGGSMATGLIIATILSALAGIAFTEPRFRNVDHHNNNRTPLTLTPHTQPITNQPTTNYRFNTLTIAPHTNADIHYIATSDTSKYGIWHELPAGTSQPHLALSDDGIAATLQLPSTISSMQDTPDITIYGPALTTITSGADSLEYHTHTPQDSLTLTATNGTIELTGTYGTLAAHLHTGAALDTDDATITNLRTTRQ